MKKYIINYMKAFNYEESDFIPCEVCNCMANDIHHIIPRSRIFGEKRDAPINLIALCRTCHDKAHFKKQPFLTVEFLNKKHKKVMNL